MKASFITALVSFVAASSAVAIPKEAAKEAAAAAAKGQASGPFSFIIESDDKRFDGKWLAPATSDKQNAPAILSSQRFRTFFISENEELTFTQAPASQGEAAVKKTARINDFLQITPLLAQITFQKQESDANGVVKSEQSFGTSNDGYFSVRGGKQWYGCTKTGSEEYDTVKVLVKGSTIKDNNCAPIKMLIVDGLA